MNNKEAKIIPLENHLQCECGRTIPYDHAGIDEDGLWQCRGGKECPYVYAKNQ